MKRMLVLATTALAMGLAGAANAADRMAATDWSGLTLGVMGSVAGGHDDWPGDGIYDLETSPFGGGFVSYDFQMGNVVFGAEAKAQFGKMEETAYPEFFYKAFYDFNGRMGYAFDGTLIHASGGLTVARIEEDGVGFTSTGYNLGAGIDFQVTEKIVAGAEYTFRSLKDDCVHDLPFELTSHSIAAKIGYRF